MDNIGRSTRRYSADGALRKDRYSSSHHIKAVGPLAGDRLAEGRYEPIATHEVDDGVLQGYSAVLNLHVRRERGELHWHYPATGREIPTFEQEREGRSGKEGWPNGKPG